VTLPKLPGRVVDVSEPVGNRFAVWTTAGIFTIKLGPPTELWEQLTPERGPERFDPADGSFRWRGTRFRLHGACGPGGALVGGPLQAEQARLRQTLERDGDRLLVRDVAGAVRQVIDQAGSAEPWSVTGFCDYHGQHLLVAHPGSVRLFRFAGSPDGGGALWQRAGDRRQQQALGRAISDAPDDDAPRLVYADWLEEHGDPDRAEFIRVQCRLAEREQFADVPFGDPDAECARLLCQANEGRWIAELPAIHAVAYSFYQAFRGFPRVQFRNPDGLVRHGERVLSATPLEAVMFYRLPPRPVARFIRTAWPERVCRLTVYHLAPGAEPGLADWLTSPRAGRMRQLKIYNCPDWTAILRAIADSRHLGRLETLTKEEYSPQPPDQQVVLALARSPHLPRLRLVSGGMWHLYPERTKAELRRRFPAIRLK
jgi:uncharacterized protein (TIGR02996 family)